MAVSIKNEEADTLVRELAALTGESLTQAIVAALRERLARVRATTGQGLAGVEDILQRYQARPRLSGTDAALYDDSGLSR